MLRFRPALPFLLMALLWYVPFPEGLQPKAWHLFIVFLATIFGIVAKSFSMGEMTLLSMVVLLLTHTLTIEESLSGFSHSVVWIVLGASLISKAFIKTGLGKRVAYAFMALFGRRAVGLGYGFALADLLLAPSMPSITARSSGVILPVLISTATAYGSKVEDGTATKLGQYLMLCAFQANVVTSALFITAHAPNSLMAQIATEHGAPLSWGTWALAALVPGLLSLAAVPWVMYWIAPPELRRTPHARDIAQQKLKEMGPLSRSEGWMVGIFILLVCCWVFGASFKLHATTVALTGVALLILTRILSWEDIIQEKSAWDVMIWYALLLMMAQSLTDSGMMKWLTSQLHPLLLGLDLSLGLLLLALLYFFLHYFFASNTAHITALYPAFLLLAIDLGVTPMLAALIFSFLSCLMGGLTHYSNTPAPILFGKNYVPLALWWKAGGLMGLVNLVIWLGGGVLWWKLLGLI